VNKIQVQSNKVCYKVSLCENFQRHSCSKTISVTDGVYKLAVNVTLEPYIWPQSNSPLSTKADFDVLVPQPKSKRTSSVAMAERPREAFLGVTGTVCDSSVAHW